MTRLKLSLLIVFLLFSAIANAWRIENNILIIEKGDNLWNISHALYAKGFDFSRLWKGRMDSISGNPNRIYDGMRFNLDSMKRPESKNDTCCPQTIINNNFTENDTTDNKAEKEKHTSWGDWWRELLMGLFKIVVFPVLAALIPKIWFKEKYTPKRFSIVLATLFGGLILWTIARNTSFSTTKTTSKSDIRHAMDTLVVKGNPLNFSVKESDSSGAIKVNPATPVVIPPAAPSIIIDQQTNTWPLALSLIIISLLTGIFIIGYGYLNRRSDAKQIAYTDIINQFHHLKNNLLSFRNNSTSATPNNPYQFFDLFENFKDAIDKYQPVISGRNSGHLKEAINDLQTKIAGGDINYFSPHQLADDLDKIKSYIQEIPATRKFFW